MDNTQLKYEWNERGKDLSILREVVRRRQFEGPNEKQLELPL